MSSFKVQFIRNDEVYFEKDISNISISQYLLNTTNTNIKDLAVKLAIQLNSYKEVNDKILVNGEYYKIITDFDRLLEDLSSINTNDKTLKDLSTDELLEMLKYADLDIIRHNIKMELNSRKHT